MCGHLTYEQFIRELRNWIIKELNLPENYVFFKKREKTGITARGDRLFVDCEVNESGSDACAIFINELYEDYLNGVSLENIGALVKRDLNQAKNLENTRYLNDYEKIKDYLFLGLVDIKWHRSELRNVVHKIIGDIAITLYVNAGSTEKGITYLKVRSEYLDEWGMEKDEVLHAALLNTYHMDPPRIYDLKRLLCDPDYEGEEFMNVEGYSISDEKKRAGICLSTKGFSNGAVAIFYPEVAEKLADFEDGDYYVVFGNVNMAVIYSAKLCHLEDLENALSDFYKNEVSHKAFLSDKIYYYPKKRNRFTMLQNRLKILITKIHMDNEE